MVCFRKCPSEYLDLTGAAPLHLAYYAHLALLYRALMNPATKVAKAMPSSSLRLWFGTALSDFASFTDFMSELNPEDLRGFWGCRTSPFRFTQTLLERQENLY